MTSIHMDTSAVKGIQKKLIKLHNAIQRDIQSSNTSVNGVFSARDWVGGSANEFNGLYNNSASTIMGIAEELAEIAEDIAEEAQRWERVSERLSR
jgi:uncharacterized protein YukE